MFRKPKHKIRGRNKASASSSVKVSYGSYHVHILKNMKKALYIWAEDKAQKGLYEVRREASMPVMYLMLC
jgi:hypothetical protein